jgi:CMP-N-acetylneuraminic acid synthetase
MSTSRETAIAIIHARGGSKRIPLKNLRDVAGKPLIAYPIALCRQLPWIDRIVVSTDHDGIMDAARRYGAEVPFRRPADISEDVASELVTAHALRELRSRGETLPEYVVTLTPATPLTRPERVHEAFERLKAHPEWDSVTTARRATEHPEWMLVLDAGSGEARTLQGNPLDGEYNVSQNLAPIHYPTGAFWINRVERFLLRPSLYGDRWGAIVMDPSEGVDIDWPADLERAERLLRARETPPA